MNEINDDLEPVKLKILELGVNESLRPAEVYYIIEHWLICCKFLDREDFSQVNGEDLEIGDYFAVSVFGDGQPSFIEFTEGIEKWIAKEKFSMPRNYKRGRVFFSRPLDGWYPKPFVECDIKKENICICLSNNNIVKKVRVAENVIFGLDKDHQLNRIWLLNIEYRKE